MHTWTDTNGRAHVIPVIDWPAAIRLKRWGVCDLMGIVRDPEAWSNLFERLGSDGEFVLNVLYTLEHTEKGTDEEQLAFGNLLVGEGVGSGPLLAAMDALRDAVIDFFPAAHRDAIRQLQILNLMPKAMKAVKDCNLEESASAIPGNGVSTSSVSSGTTATA